MDRVQIRHKANKVILRARDSGVPAEAWLWHGRRVNKEMRTTDDIFIGTYTSDCHVDVIISDIECALKQFESMPKGVHALTGTRRDVYWFLAARGRASSDEIMDHTEAIGQRVNGALRGLLKMGLVKRLPNKHWEVCNDQTTR